MGNVPPRVPNSTFNILQFNIQHSPFPKHPDARSISSFASTQPPPPLRMKKGGHGFAVSSNDC
jgi:hypothetical protein